MGSRLYRDLSISVYICLNFDLLLFLLLWWVAQENRKSNQGKHKGWVSVLLSILAAFGKDLLEPNQQIVVLVSIALVRHHVHKAGHTFLTFFKLKRLFATTLLIIDE